jgi:hypothetical protein
MERKLRFFSEQVDKEKRDMLAERGLNTDDISSIVLEDTTSDKVVKDINIDDLEVASICYINADMFP